MMARPARRCAGRARPVGRHGWSCAPITVTTSGERGIWGKPAVPLYGQMMHLPLIIWWPGLAPPSRDDRRRADNVRRHPATIAEVFGVADGSTTARTGARSSRWIAGDRSAIRDWALAGVWGLRYKSWARWRVRYSRTPVGDNGPLAMWSNRWSTMPVHAFPQVRLPGRTTGRARPHARFGFPVIRQPFDAGDRLPSGRHGRSPGITSSTSPMIRRSRRIIADDVEEVIPGERPCRPERQPVARVERLADHRDIRTGHGVERGRLSGRGSRTCGKACTGIVDHRFDHIASGALSPTGAPAYAARRRADDLYPRPQTRRAPSSRMADRSPAISGTSELPCVRWSMSSATPNTSAMWRGCRRTSSARRRSSLAVCARPGHQTMSGR